MPMTRANALTYLVNKYTALATLTGQGVADDATGFGPAIDDALLLLDVPYSSLAGYSVADGSVRNYRLLLRLCALRGFSDQLASFNTYDITADGFTAKRAAELIQVNQLLVEATAEATNAGFVITGNIMRLARINLDYLEPAIP
jgi:hypothetical protein